MTTQPARTQQTTTQQTTTQQVDDLTLRLERRICARRERVFAAWTEPDQLRRWSAPEGMTVSDGELDLRPGGQWRVVMLEPDGTPHEAFGTYREVTPPERLVYTHAWRQCDDVGQDSGSTPETVVTVEFIAEGDATLVVLTQRGFGSAASRDGHDEGWSSALDNLERMFAEATSASENGSPASLGGVAVMRHQARITHMAVRAALSDMSHDDSLLQPPAGNCANWVLGHILKTYNDILPLVGRPQVRSPEPLARYARGGHPVTGPDDALPLDELLSSWDDVCANLDAGLSGITVERLAEHVPDSPTGDPGETVASLISTVLFHQAYHAGQLGMLRRLAGKARAFG